MPSLITDHPLALRILMDSDIYPLKEQEVRLPGKTDLEPAKAIESAEAIPVIEKPEEKPEKASIAYNYLGENNKYLLVLLNDTDYEFCAPKTLEALTNLLKARQMEIKDIALVNLARHNDASFSSFKSYFACSKIVLFGINPAQIGLKEITSNQISLVEGVKILASYSFAEMDQDVAKKRTFWNEMKLL